MWRSILNKNIVASCLFNMRQRNKRYHLVHLFSIIKYYQKSVSTFFFTSLFSIRDVCIYFRALVFLPFVDVIREVASDEWRRLDLILIFFLSLSMICMEQSQSHKLPPSFVVKYTHTYIKNIVRKRIEEKKRKKQTVVITITSTTAMMMTIFLEPLPPASFLVSYY